MLIKEKFHKFIDQIEDERTLEAYFNLILKLNTHENGKLFSSLTIKQKEELEISYHESFVERTTQNFVQRTFSHIDILCGNN